MTSFLSNLLGINVKSDELVSFLHNMNNFRLIMPEQIENWESDHESCSFFIKNLGKLGMKKSLENEQNQIKFISSDVSKVKFTLLFHFKNNGNSRQEISFELLSEMNSMVEMMARRPLINFVNMLTTNLKQHFSA